jgi:hypothetical protein
MAAILYLDGARVCRAHSGFVQKPRFVDALRA